MTLLPGVDARVRPAFFPVRKLGVLSLDGLELAAHEGRGLCVFDRILNRSIGILNAASVGDAQV